MLATEEKAEPRAWAETRISHPDDMAIRKILGGTIHSRPRKGDTMWRLDGILYTQAEMVMLCKGER